MSGRIKKNYSLQNQQENRATQLILQLKDIKGVASCKDLSITDILPYLTQNEVSFRRLKHQIIEKIVSKALNNIEDKETDKGEDSLDEEFAKNEMEALNLMVDKDTNRMNKGITKMWEAKEEKLATLNRTQSLPPSVGKVDASVKFNKRKSENENLEPSTKSNKISSKSPYITLPTAKLSDLGGIDVCINEVLELVALPLFHSEIYSHLGIKLPRGILLHGPSGCGKTLLANAIAGHFNIRFLCVSAPSLIAGMSGESERQIRDLFNLAKAEAPCLLFLDEIDAITPKRDTAQREMERRIVGQLLTCLDDLDMSKNEGKPVLVMGATNRPDAIDPALRRAGRFDREIAMTVPDEIGRTNILKVLCSNLRLDGELDLKVLARRTPGYVGSDLSALTSAAGTIAVKRIFDMMKLGQLPQLISKIKVSIDLEAQTETIDIIETEQTTETNSQMNHADNGVQQLSLIQKFLERYPNPLTEEQLAPLAIQFADFIEALGKVQPSSKREGFATIPDVTWDDIGALSKVRDELRMAVVEPMQHPELFQAVGIQAPAGVLLWGPPGCGKTLLAKAVANQSHSNFIAVKGPELLNKYVGESERAVRQVFQRARSSQPCVVFFDELDALCPRRDSNQSEATARVVNTLLTELDGLESRQQVFIIAATNRPDIIDGAMLRPGRLDKMLYVELPDPQERFDILKTVTKRTPLQSDVDLQAIANDLRCDGFSGADITSLVREASVTALRKILSTGTKIDPEAKITVSSQDFNTAFTKVAPSVTKADRKTFEALRVKFGWH